MNRIMNPWPMLRADLQALRWTAAAVIALIALAVGVSLSMLLIERGLRQSSARAAEDFDLLIGAAGSQTQLVLSAVYLQLEALPLVDGGLLAKLEGDRRVRAVAPLAFGDLADGYPIVGTTPDFATRWGKLVISEGRMFTGAREAVLGADVALPLGAAITPIHAVAGVTHRPGVRSEGAEEHAHAGVAYIPVGRLPRLNSPWDRAVLVPVESVWEVHGLWPRTLHPAPGVPAIVVKPSSVADAYALRAEHRRGATMALFPAEVLVSLYGVIGDAQSLMLAVSILNAGMTFAAILLLLWTINGLRARRYAVLRALGAPRLYIFALVWLNAAALLITGSVLGIALSLAAARIAGAWAAGLTGLDISAGLSPSDVGLVILMVFAGSVLALAPAYLASREAPLNGLRAGS